MDRHLLPHEYDLLLDGDSGFGLGPLRAHVRDCDACRAEFEEAQAVLAELDHLPHLATTPGFADRVMREVHVFEPWHVALTDFARSLVPASPALRVAGALAALGFGGVFTLASLWLLARVDLLALSTGVTADRSREALGAFGRSLAGALLGDGAEGASVALLAGAVGLAVLGAVAGTAGLRAAVARGRAGGDA